MHAAEEHLLKGPTPRRVLLVEDDSAHARLTTLQLADAGFAETDRADTLAGALDRLRTRTYDAILLDLGLPDAQGLEGLRHVLAATADAPVLVLTSADDDDQATRAVRMGAQDFLVKGQVDARRLRRAISYGVERKRLLRGSLSASMFENLLNLSRNAVLALNPAIEDGGRCWRVLLANPPCEAVFGRPRREIEGARLDAVLVPAVARELAALLEPVLEGGGQRQQIRVGEGAAARWMMVDALPFSGKVAVIMTDVTQMKRREEQLRAAQERAQKALDEKVGLLHALEQKVPSALRRMLGRIDSAAAAVGEASPAKADLTGARAEVAALASAVDALASQRQSAGFAYLGANYLSVLEISPDLAAVVRAGDGAVMFVNRVGREVLDIGENQPLSALSFFDFVPDDYSVLFESGMAALRGEATRVPMHLARADGQLIDVELMVADCPADGIEDWAGEDLVLVSAVDTTRRNRASRRIIAREEQLRKIMDNVADAIVVVDEDGRIETLNRATETTFGIPSRDLVGTNVGRLLGPARGLDGPALSGLATFLRGGVPARITGWRRHFGRRGRDELFPIELAVRDLNLGERHLFIGLIRDISERVAYEEDIVRMATHDLLTGLANRTHFQDVLGMVLAAARETGNRVALMFFDLNRFKAINDSYGHLVGDRVLTVFAKRLTASLGQRARLLARLSADEFVAILDKTGGEAELLPIAGAVTDAVKVPVIVDNHDIRLSCSVGIAEYPDAGPHTEALVRGAEFAVRTAKARGRDSVQVYDESLSASLVYRQRLETALVTAVEADELQVYYQPKIDLQKGGIVGAEALIRWFHPELGLVSPVAFIPIAEETGQIRDIGEWVLRRVCQDQAARARSGAAVVPVAVNLSAVQFRDANLDRALRGILEEFDLPPKLLELELTESALVEDIDQTVETLSRLKGLGLSIAIDDFGSGYSSFGYLTRFPIDSLKIDRAFVCNIPANRDDMTVTKAIIGMAKALDLMLVAEGVETVEQARFLKDQGCDMAQGYLYSRPVPLGGFQRLLDDGVPRLA
ncbi:Diguanylate cyclase [uncultured Alphaproteobacteria bacterium]|uniref:Diguanylate cyclase n=1 Tax=uncultured Alphaproteobacteria bacterium TaxID=91750 RepID=A0A212IWK2_9PROT|nr:Diguanylate cyclase [uncultured Alphaproteobacteria bacterium]